MRRVFLFLLLACVPLMGCRPPGGSAAAKPEFTVETWDGKTRTGTLRWDGDAPVVSGRRVAREDVRSISRRTGGPTGAAAQVEGFAPLAAAQLDAYRERAEAAAKKFPGIDSVLCLDYAEDTLTTDGQHVWRYHALILVLKEKGRENADLQLGFSEGRSRRRVFFARSVSPGGRARWLDPATLKVATPAQGQLHLDTRSRVLSGRIPGAEIGSLIEYAYESLNYNPAQPDLFFPSYFFRGEQPYLDSIIDVRVPAGRKLNWITRLMPKQTQEPKRSRRGAYDVYRWAMHDAPPIVPEPLMPDKSDVVPRVECSLFFDWKDLHKLTGDYQRERIQTTPEIKKLAAQIVGDAKSDDGKLARIYYWVQRKINYLSVKGSRSSGWAGHPASETIRNGYGDCTDKAIVLASLAKAVGITSYPVILKTNDEGAAITELPVPDANHCISVVYPNGKPRFIDSTAENYRYPYFRADDHGVKAIVHMTGEILDIPVPKPQDNLRRSLRTLILKPDGSATCVERNAYNGSYEARVRGFWRSVPPTLHPRMMQQYLQRRAPGALCAGFQLTQLDDLNTPLQMEIRYGIPKLATLTRDLYIVSPPGLARQFPEAALPTRQYAIERRTSEGYENVVQVTCPDGYTLVAVPEPLTIRGKHLVFDGKVEAAKDGKSLTLRESLERPTRIVPVADYAAFRRHAARIAAWTRLKLVFRKTPGS